MENNSSNNRRTAASIAGQSMACETARFSVPYEGMAFESEAVARAYYEQYAMQTGFSTRILTSRKSKHDGSIISCRFGCRCTTDHSEVGGKLRGDGCTAILLIKKDSVGKWIVQKFVQEHNHPLVVSLPKRGATFDEKDRRIQELTTELRAKKRLSAAYREQLLILMKDVENHSDRLTEKVNSIRSSLKGLET